jgi:RNA polymerase sigma factor (sigma-70 family)
MLGRSRHDRWFARFAAKGDVRALGAVFDATAPELLRIAAHLVGSRDVARDLVQGAFLIAIERRAEFDRHRRVLPWLCGIVANLARNERRRAARDAVVPAREPTADPSSAAEAREFRAALARAKDALPELYRPVVDLHLEQGMAAVEIADALGRPAGTVRTQIVRGLELLRRELPRGLAVAVVPLDLAVLRPARAAVLRHAATALPVPVPAAGVATAGVATFVFVGAGTMSKKLTAAAVLGLLVALGLWLAAPSLARVDAPRESRAEPAAVAAAPREAAGDGARGAEAAAGATTMARREFVEVPAPVAAPTGSLEVVARWGRDDVPAAGIAIEVVHDGDALGEVGARSALTDAEGRARFERLPPGPVLVQASTNARREAVVVANEQANVALQLDGLPVTGLVVDHLGQPVAGADVWVSSDVGYSRQRADAALSRVRYVDAPRPGQYGRCTLRTDERGRFATRLRRTQCLAAWKEGHGPSLTACPLAGRPKTPERPTEVVLQLQPAGGALTVTVRGAGGAPLAGALVLVGSELPAVAPSAERASIQATAHVTLTVATRMTTPARRASTDEAGIAAFAALQVGRLPVQVRAAHHAPWSGEVDVLPGRGASLDVALGAGAVVTGVVRDADGEPLASALVHHGPFASLRGSRATTDANGAFRLEHLPGGNVEIAAFHEDWGNVRHALELEPDVVATWDPRMPPRATITGVVLDHEGRPVAGTTVLADGGSAGGEATAETDDAGRFRLSPLVPGAVYHLAGRVELRSGGHVNVHRADVAAGANVELRVEAAQVPTARLRGRVLENGGAPARGCDVHVTPLGGMPASRHTLDADGRFEIGPWKAQRVRLSVHAAGTFGAALADFGVQELQTGTTIDAGDLVLPLPATLRVRVAGLGDADGAATLFRDGERVDEQRVTADTLVWERLPPGAYTVCVTRGGARPQCGVGEAALGAGHTADVAVAVTAATLRDIGFGRRPRPRSEAAPAANVITFGGPTILLRATDAGGRTLMLYRTAPEHDGTATRLVVPDTAVTLTAECDDGRSGSASLAVPAGEPVVIPLTRR